MAAPAVAAVAKKVIAYYVIKKDENLEPMSANEIQIELANLLIFLAYWNTIDLWCCIGAYT